jgi:hypothetical protein
MEGRRTAKARGGQSKAAEARVSQKSAPDYTERCPARAPNNNERIVVVERVAPALRMLAGGSTMAPDRPKQQRERNARHHAVGLKDADREGLAARTLVAGGTRRPSDGRL